MSIDDDKLFDDLLLDDEDTDDADDGSEEESEDEVGEEGDKSEDESGGDDRSQKNRDAEEARKRREAEKKAKEAEKAEADKKAKESAEKEKEKRTNELGRQLVSFSKKYPDVDIAKLEKDKTFKKFIAPQLLGKRSFTELYEDYVEIKSGGNEEESKKVQENYRKKAEASSGSSIGAGEGSPSPGEDVFSEAEYNRILQRAPFMTDAEYEKVSEKLERSEKLYSKKK